LNTDLRRSRQYRSHRRGQEPRLHGACSRLWRSLARCFRV